MFTRPGRGAPQGPRDGIEAAPPFTQLRNQRSCPQLPGFRGRPDRRHGFPAVGGTARRREQRLGADGQSDSRTDVETLLFDVNKARDSAAVMLRQRRVGAGHALARGAALYASGASAAPGARKPVGTLRVAGTGTLRAGPADPAARAGG